MDQKQKQKQKQIQKRRTVKRFTDKSRAAPATDMTAKGIYSTEASDMFGDPVTDPIHPEGQREEGNTKIRKRRQRNRLIKDFTKGVIRGTDQGRSEKIKSEMAGSIPIVINKTPRPTSILSCIPTENMFIWGAIFAIMPSTALSRSMTPNTGRNILNPITT